MEHQDSGEYLAECFWPEVRESDLADLDRRAQAAAAESSHRGVAVGYLGSLLMRQDEVVLCRFTGSESAVRRAAERAAIPFERIVAAAHSPWPNDSAERSARQDVQIRSANPMEGRTR